MFQISNSKLLAGSVNMRPAFLNMVVKCMFLKMVVAEAGREGSSLCSLPLEFNATNFKNR